MHRGYIKLWRKTLDNGIVQNPELLRFWIWSLMKATHKPCTVMVGYQEVNLEPGQFVFGRKKAATELKSSEKKIRTCVQSLSNSKNLAIKSASKFSIITINNWHTYQEDDDDKGHQIGQERAIKGPSKGHKQECKAQKEELIDLPKGKSLSCGNGKTRQIPYQEIISFLNETCQTKFRPDTGTTRNMIKARFNEGFDLEDFKAVISTKAGQWLTEPKMVQYLRPQTLFGTKFESYLTESSRAPVKKETKLERMQREWEEKHGIAGSNSEPN